MKATTRTRRIGFLLYPDITALDLVGPMEAFGAANAHREAPLYELIVIGLDRKPTSSESGLTLMAQVTLDEAPPLDTVIVPGGRGLRDAKVANKLVPWLTARARATRRIASVCTGIYGLAPSGLLDGRRVTTHWAFARDVSERFPALEVDADAIFIKDGKFYTSAGITAGIDLSLALIEEDAGPSVALAVARELVVHMKRAGGQAQYSEPLRFQMRAKDRFADLAAWIPTHLHEPLTVQRLAGRARMGVRHFNRLFKATLGSTPAIFIEAQRLDEACRRLTAARTTVDAVAASVGYRSADVFTRAFQRRFGVSPKEYRARFSANAV